MMRASVEQQQDPDTSELSTAVQPLQTHEPVRVPQYRRDIFPRNLLLSAEDVRDLCLLLADANERAKAIEFLNLDLSGFESEEQARARVNEFMPLEYNYRASTGDSVTGLGIPKTDEHTFPDDLQTFFVSNSSYASRAINLKPLNAVDAFFAFEKPSLKLDLQTVASNPTPNDSVINVYGRDEDWVVATADRINKFLEKRAAFRPIIHGSGAYDYLMYMVFLPLFMWIVYKRGSGFTSWMNNQSIFLNVLVGIYCLLIALLLWRFIFMYTRWLFPPMEYYRRSRTGALLHRAAAGLAVSALVAGATYDIIKLAINWALGG